MHDLLLFCSRLNFLNRPTLIFARLSTGFLENRTVFSGSFFMCGLKTSDISLQRTKSVHATVMFAFVRKS